MATTSPPQPRRALDLTAAADHLAREGLQKPFVSQVRRFRDAESAKYDLQAATRLLERRSEITRGVWTPGGAIAQTNESGELAGAAFNQALLLYVRIVTNNEDRTEIPLHKGGSAEISEAHDRVIALRHGGVGHFNYLRDHPGGAVARDRVLIVHNGDSSLPYLGVDHARANYKEANVDDLAMVIKHGSIAIEGIIQDRYDNLNEALSKLDASIWKLIDTFRTYTHPDGERRTTVSPSGTGLI